MLGNEFIDFMKAKDKRHASALYRPCRGCLFGSVGLLNNHYDWLKKAEMEGCPCQSNRFVRFVQCHK